MSLRYKALIAVFLLVAGLTGFLVISSSQLFEQDARERIHKELLKDQRILDERISNAARISRTGMKASAASSELVRLFTVPELDSLNDNLLPFAQDWLRDAEGDIAIAGIDTFVAEDRGASVIGNAGENLSFVAVVAKDELAETRQNELLSDPELVGFMARFFERSFEEEPESLDRSEAAVLPVAGRVYLVVQNYLWESIQDKLVIGVGCVLTELSRDWLNRSEQTEDVYIDEIDKIVFAGGQVAGTTLADSSQAEHVLDKCLEVGAVKDDRVLREFEFEVDDESHLGIAFSSDLSPEGLNHRPGFIAFKSLEKEFAPFIKLRNRVFLIAGGLGLLCAILAYFGAYLVIAKLRRIEEATTFIREGKFDTRVNIGGRDELAKLGKAFNDMTTGLKALGMYTHDTLAKNLLDNPQLLGSTSTRDEGSIFFSDIKGFTTISESMSAEDLTSQLNEYFAALGRKLKEERGYVDKFIGDSIMAFWGPPFIKEGDYAVRACETAIEALKVAAQLREQWKNEGKPLFYQRIGIATGEVVIGNIGTDTKKNFTVIGDSVNLASRLEGANKLYGTEILVDERTYELAKRFVVFREVDQILVVGKSQPVRVYQPLALVGGETATYAHEYSNYEVALGHYRRREFDQAISALEQLLAKRPEDGPSLWLRALCEVLKAGVPKDWEPVTTATSK